MTTLLYFPFLELFLSVMRCYDGFHYIYTEQECWTRIYFFDSTIAIFCSLVFILLSWSVSLLFYEKRNLVEFVNEFCGVKTGIDLY